MEAEENVPKNEIHAKFWNTVAIQISPECTVKSGSDKDRCPSITAVVKELAKWGWSSRSSGLFAVNPV